MCQYPLVSVYCQVYNTAESYLRKCIESVLSQTYKNLEFFVLDNGCTDDSSKILEKYAKTEPRIHLISANRNRSEYLDIEVAPYFKGKYYTHIDSDDWWTPNYLKQLVAFSENNNLDIACTGCVFHSMDECSSSERRLPLQLVLSHEQFADGLSTYHCFLRTVWGKLIRLETFRQANLKKHLDMKLPYGTDTLVSFSLLRKTKFLGIDNSAMYHYRIHKKSKSYQYNFDRFKSDVYLYNDAIDFLSAYGPVSEQNKQFLSIVYANALSDTIGVINGASLSPSEKLAELRKIVSHPITHGTYRRHDQSIQRSRDNLLISALNCGGKLQEDSEDFRAVVQSLVPQCGPAISPQVIPLLAQNLSLLEALQSDNREALLRQILALTQQKKYTKKFDWGDMVRKLALDKLPLCNVEDIDFLRTYQELYLTIWQGHHAEALDTMTGLLLEGKVTVALETFLTVYVSLAALCEQVPAFLFGKEQLALVLFEKNRLEECREILSELAEMGVEDSEVIVAIKQALEGAT